MTEENSFSPELLEYTAAIVASFVSHNSVSPSDLPRLITDVHASLKSLGTEVAEEPVKLEPAVSPRKSVTPDYIICLEDGKKFKSLKRHLRTHYNMSPDEYRAKWNLPADYPMVAPNYSAVRSQLAKDNGLGRAPEAVKKRATRGTRTTKQAA